MKECIRCFKKMPSRRRGSQLFCSRGCFSQYKSEQMLVDYLSGNWNGSTSVGLLSKTVKNYLLVRANRSCELCGWNIPHTTSGVPPLEIHHKDGDSTNNVDTNLQVLCPNCHALTENHRGRNKKSGRVERRGPTCVNCGGHASRWGGRCKNCVERKTKIIWPELETLQVMVKATNYVQVGKQLGVSDNAVRVHIHRRTKKMDSESVN